MGCCLSTTNRLPPQKHKHLSRFRESRAPPPSSSEEETVKEVLSSVTRTPNNCNPIIHKTKGQDDKKEEEEDKFPKVEKMEPELSPREETSELLSDICSLSESVSTVTERRDYDDSSRDDCEVRQFVKGSTAKFSAKSRSFSGEFGTKRERVVGKSPTRRSDRSPGRRNAGSVKVVQGREPVQQMVRRRRDPGERSGRRYASPATREDGGAAASNLGRVPSGRRTNRSPARISRNPLEKGNGKSGGKNDYVEGKEQAAKESLENPLVSLECFIFL